MFILSTNESETEYQEVEKVLTAVKELNEQCKQQQLFILIEFENHGSMEIALGMGQESILYYTPEDETLDEKITCNEKITRSKNEDIRLTDVFGEPCFFNVANTISMEDALIALETYLRGEDFLALVDWYTYH